MLGRLCYEEMTKFGGPRKSGYFEVSVGLLLLGGGAGVIHDKHGAICGIWIQTEYLPWERKKTGNVSSSVM